MAVGYRGILTRHNILLYLQIPKNRLTNTATRWNTSTRDLLVLFLPFYLYMRVSKNQGHLTCTKNSKHAPKMVSLLFITTTHTKNDPQFIETGMCVYIYNEDTPAKIHTSSQVDMAFQARCCRQKQEQEYRSHEMLVRQKGKLFRRAHGSAVFRMTCRKPHVAAEPILAYMQEQYLRMYTSK